MKNRIFYTKPSITELEIKYANDAVKNGWGDQCYEYINRLEEMFKKHLGVNFAIATSSCTGAMHMGMAALGISAGDEVILADTNWIATASPIMYLGAKPIFVDILSDTWCIDPEKVEAAITSKTKAIIAVHLYGNLCDMDRLEIISKKYEIPIIEDAAEAIGSVYQSKKAGSIGKFGTFSFHGTKTITTGEGGMFVTNDEDLYERVLTLSNHGRSRKQEKQFWPDLVGFKYKISNIQASIGCAQLERIKDLIERKREIMMEYHKHLDSLNTLKMNPEPIGVINGFWMPTVVFEEGIKINTNRIQQAFKRENIDARRFFWALSSLPIFNDCPQNINALSIPERAINLPSYHDITIDEINRVTEVIVKLSRR